jgi:DNA-binding NtrC family response regulator
MIDRPHHPLPYPMSSAVSSLVLTLLPLSDHVPTAWSALASECGFVLVTATEPTDVGRASGVVAVIDAEGAEELIEPTLQKIAPAGAEIAAIGAIPDHRLAVSAMRAGAAEYFALPADFEILRSWLCDRAERMRTRENGSAFAEREEAKYGLDGVIGTSAALRHALDSAGRVIPHGDVTVLIIGESGTGKERLARAIHYNGPRRRSPFVEISCTAVPEPLLESQLFGHEKGADNSAAGARPGLFEFAGDGTLFLEQVDHLPLSLQGKLLRALEERAVRRVGGTRAIPIRSRVIAATDVDLTTAVRRGQFREDLYYRLSVFPISVPPLRAYREDILPLARHFLARFAREYDLPEPTLSEEAEQALTRHVWPGNVRELCNAMERAVLVSAGGRVEAADLALDRHAAVREERVIPFPATLDEINRVAAAEMLDACHGQKSEAARRLGISRSRLLRLLTVHSDHQESQDVPRD